MGNDIGGLDRHHCRWRNHNAPLDVLNELTSNSSGILPPSGTNVGACWRSAWTDNGHREMLGIDVSSEEEKVG